MPYLNSAGKWCCGIAGTGVYANDTTIWGPGYGGGAQWRSLVQVIGQRTFTQDSIGLYSHDLIADTDDLLHPGPISMVVGVEQGHWAIQTNESGFPVVRDSFGRRHPGAGVLDGAVGPDGSIVIKDLYHSSGPYTVWEADGTTWQLTTGEVYDLQNYGQHRVTWKDQHSQYHAVGLPRPEPLTFPSYWFRYVYVDGYLWQLYQAGPRLVFHPYGDPWGYIITIGDAFRSDARYIGEGNDVRFVWSTQQRDWPQDVVQVDKSLSDERVDLSPIVSVTPYNENKLIGAIWANSDRYGYHQHGGNAETFFEGDYDLVVDPVPVIVGRDASNVPAERTLGKWIVNEASDDPRFTRAFVYYDGRNYPQALLDELRSQDVPLFQAYPNPGESVDDFKEEMIDQLSKYDGPKMIVAAFYDRNGTLPIYELEHHMPTYDSLLRRDDVIGMLAFDYARSGILYHPLLEAWYNAFTAASPGLPALPQPEKPVSIKTTISHLVSSFIDNDFDKPLETRPAHVTGWYEVVEVVKNTDGTYSIKSGDGDEWLSVQREGTIQSRPVSDPAQPRSWEKFDRVGNTLVERNKDAYGGFVPPTRGPVTFLVAGDL